MVWSKISLNLSTRVFPATPWYVDRFYQWTGRSDSVCRYRTQPVFPAQRVGTVELNSLLASALA
jgi:hypothetical protein